MPRKKHSELTAGLFVVAGIAVLLGVVLWLGAADLLRTRGQLASFYVPMSAGSVGIIEGAEVTLGDGRIGRIVEVRPDPDPNGGRCLYHARMERDDIVIRKDANAIVVSPAIGQAKVVLLHPGTSDVLADDGNAVLLSGGLDQAMRHISQLAENLSKTAEDLRRQMDGNDPNSLLTEVHAIAGDLGAAAKNVVAMTGNVRDETMASNPNSIVAKLHHSVADVNKTTAQLALETDSKAPGTVMAKISSAAGHVETQTDANAAGSLVAKVHGTLGEVDATVKESRPQIKRTLTAVADAAEKVEGYVNKDIAEMLASLRQANTKILKIAGDFEVVSEQAKEIVTLNRDNIDEMIDNLTQVSVDLKSAAKEVRRNPWRLLYTPEQKELRSQNLYDAVRAFSNGAEQLDQSLAKLRLLQKIESDDPLLKGAVERVRKQLLETFGKLSKAEQALWKELEK